LAAAKGNEAVARLLLDYGADIDSKDKDGGTALHWAATYGHEAMERLLLKKGVNTDAMNDWGDMLRPTQILIGSAPRYNQGTMASEEKRRRLYKGKCEMDAAPCRPGRA
jgi:hypothetical protein